MEEEQLKNKLKLWFRRELKLGDDCVLLVSETCCNKTNQKETILIVHESCNPAKIKIYKIEKAMDEISETDVRTKLISQKLFKSKDVRLTDLKLSMASKEEVYSNNNQHEHHHKHEHNARIVVYITAIVMVLEIGFGYYTGSMSLLADGWHMASHVFAIGLCWVAYFFARKNKTNARFKNGTGKILSLSGYTSAVILLIIAVLMVVESVQRFMKPEEIRFKEAIVVSIIGFLVNAVCAKFLHHDHEHSDHNIKAAYIHVLADMLTSIVAIIALVTAYYWNILFLDAVGGLLGAMVIINWAIGLLKNSGRELLDYH